MSVMDTQYPASFSLAFLALGAYLAFSSKLGEHCCHREILNTMVYVSATIAAVT
jgi:hypothetical protein